MAVRMLEVSVRKRASPQFELQAEFSAAPGFSILFGPSGAGKTTLLDCICGLRVPDAGRISINGRVIYDGEKTSVPVPLRKVGYVFQSLALFPHHSVEENIQYGLAGMPLAERTERSSAILRSFGILHLREQKPGKISGGERQRVALARSLVTEPEVLLLDEPLSGLDRVSKETLFAELRRWNEVHAIPILYVTHSYREALTLGERVILLEAGKIQAQGDAGVLGEDAGRWE